MILGHPLLGLPERRRSSGAEQLSGNDAFAGSERYACLDDPGITRNED